MLRYVKVSHFIIFSFKRAVLYFIEEIIVMVSIDSMSMHIKEKRSKKMNVCSVIFVLILQTEIFMISIMSDFTFFLFILTPNFKIKLIIP